MACVTLKRPLDHFSEPLHVSPGHHHPHPHHGPPSKRRRCVPVRQGGGRNKGYDDHLEDALAAVSPSGSAASFPSASATSSSSSSPSVFTESTLSPSQIANNLRDELRRLKRRRQLAAPTPRCAHAGPASPGRAPPPPPPPPSPPPRSPGSPGSPGSPEPMMDDAAAVRAAAGILSGQGAANSALLHRAENKPIFTLKQMTMICERMCKERTDHVREEYDRILNQKLSEQYESFVRFIDQQIQRRFSQAQLPSYLS